jgi:hypothetical protein
MESFQSELMPSTDGRRAASDGQNCGLGSFNSLLVLYSFLSFSPFESNMLISFLSLSTSLCPPRVRARLERRVGNAEVRPRKTLFTLACELVGLQREPPPGVEGDEDRAQLCGGALRP